MSAALPFKVRDSSSYDAVAHTFDKLTRRLAQPIAARVISLAGANLAGNLLDVGTGTGIVALEASARTAGQGCSVTGIDLSEGMLAVARENAARLRLSVRFLRMDAEDLEFPGASFDRVVSMFALLHLPNPLRGLQEMLRVLRPGGSAVVAVGSGAPIPSLDGFKQAFRLVPDFLAERRGRLLRAPEFLDSLVREYVPHGGTDEVTALAGSTHHHSRTVPNLMRRSGFVGVAHSWIAYRAEVDTIDEFWELQHTYSSYSRKRLAEASPKVQTAVKREFDRRCESVRARGGRLIYPYAALLVSGRRSSVPSPHR